MPHLIVNLIKSKSLKSPAIITAFQNIRRDDFVLPQYRYLSHLNVPLPIGHGQTISQPETVALMLEILDPKTGEKILDVGSGSGWTTALLAHIVGAQGRVYALERIKEIKEFGEKNVNKYGFIKSQRAKMFHGDGHLGLPRYAPFDKILVSAATLEAPQKLLDQLKIGGRIVVPIGRHMSPQDIFAIDRLDNNNFHETKYSGFVFVPLVKGKYTNRRDLINST
ncbi:protein-L-isoaspartate(D-aspartate) O-methyltransferase [Candidatus Falkowbacteria bacterium]|nr:protein-L-isoaspartate(D-aspartate) O-methyltransferase [Candidatus Falkowbacteria bacterium]